MTLEVIFSATGRSLGAAASWASSAAFSATASAVAARPQGGAAGQSWPSAVADAGGCDHISRRCFLQWQLAG